MRSMTTRPSFKLVALVVFCLLPSIAVLYCNSICSTCL